MARIRTVKPEFWGNPQMQKESDATKLLALALLNFADDEGFFFANPNMVRSQCRPLDDDSTIVRRSLEDLSRIGYIEVVETATHGAVGRIVKFLEHQRIDRPKSSDIKRFFNSSNDRRSIYDQSSGEGKGREGKKDSCSSPAALNEKVVGSLTAQATYSPEFEQFWSAYPRKKNKGTAWRSWAKSKSALKDILKALEWQIKSDDWTRDGGQYIPHPSTYLNSRSWEDEPTVAIVAAAPERRLAY